MKFLTGSQMLNQIGLSDLYSREKGIYVFEYNNCGSIAYYYLTTKVMEELKRKAEITGECISGLLGVGGYICDDPSYEDFEEGDYSNLDWCNENYDGEWEVL